MIEKHDLKSTINRVVDFRSTLGEIVSYKNDGIEPHDIKEMTEGED